MNRVIQTLLWCIVLPVGSYAQTAPTSFALDDCIKYALENTIEVKNARVDEQIAQSKVKETYGIGLPQIDGNVSLQHNGELPRFFATYAVAQGFSGNDEIFLLIVLNHFTFPLAGLHIEVGHREHTDPIYPLTTPPPGNGHISVL